MKKLMKIYYNALTKISRRTIEHSKKIKPLNKFSKYYTHVPILDEKVNVLIANSIQQNIPLMAARYGSIELEVMANVISYKNSGNIILDSFNFLLGNKSQFWDIDQIRYNALCINAGFFPNGDISLLNTFTNLMIDASKDLDILGVWVGLEEQIFTIPEQTYLVQLRALEPWFYQEPWTFQLKGKKVLVIHPFEDSIKRQYKKRENLFENKKVLPEFDLKTIKAVQTISDNNDYKYKNWFEALEFMKREIDKVDFDVAIIGCGAYGFPLASYVKKLGKQAIHLGGMVQWLFGIKGQRWMDFERYKYMPNEFWVFPLESEKPKGYKKVEGGCYW
ncbi:hypothetical protein ETU10_00415 [Apibacter muscae]|uniref:hypothetical protein n=1 Tax=Apibacter muscae TaxID=2509004 RepID=UPI0011ADE2EA|nr:hypothetical protein [Apibacter muscae]TWP25132.1 hypothetical protein ETU10_00415 [Apibacter muscae]